MKTKLLILTCTTMLIACTNTNPFLTENTNPYGVPAFDQIKPEHYMPAFEKALAESEKEIAAITDNTETPTFDNTIVALDRSGELLDAVSAAFFNVLEADGNRQLEDIAEQISPRLSQHSDRIMLSDKLFDRIRTIYEQREQLNLNDEQMRLLTETYKSFVRSGALLNEADKQRLMQINEQLSVLSLKFGQNVQNETNNCEIFITDEQELSGLPESAKQAAKELAEQAGRPDAWKFYPTRTSFVPVLQYADNRELRKTLLMAYTTRGNHDNEYDNKQIINQTMHLRLEKAQLLGYQNPADYQLDDCMAHDSKTVDAFLESVWKPSLAKATQEAAALQQLLEADLPGETLQPWDWWYYAEKLRKRDYDIDEQQLKPYFELNAVRNGAFEVAHRLYGLQFEPLNDMPVYNKDVEVFRVTDADNQLIGILYTDYFPRAGKRPGAWMENICSQYVDAAGVDHRPVIINVGNFTKPTATEPSLLSMDDVETLFHEFGHAIHGLLSKATYKTLSGTNVPRDFVEMPSQFMENYCYEPEVMRLYAKHYQTGEVIPDALIEKINNASKFNQGFVETELLSASILDMDYHEITDTADFDVNAFEQASMQKMQMIPQIIVRYRSTFFNHIFMTGYEAGYYSYTWSAVLDSDAFYAFKETGDIFNPEVAARFRHLLEQGGTKDAQELYNEFRGRQADPKYLLIKKGLIEE